MSSRPIRLRHWPRPRPYPPKPYGDPSAPEFASPPWYQMVGATIDSIYLQELYRHADMSGAATWFYYAREEGKDADWIREQIRNSAEWHAIHDPKPEPPKPIIPAPTRLRANGRMLVDEAGHRFAWYGLSAFPLAYDCVHGKDARPTFEWCHRNRVTVVRVFLMCANLFPLTPDDGRAGLEILLPQAADFGIYVEGVCNLDTFAFPYHDARGHVTAVGQLARAYPNLLVEGWNEPGQNDWQPATKEEMLAAFADFPADVPYTLGAADGPNDESREYCDPSVTWQNVHCDRTRAPWGNVRHVREQQVLSEEIDQWVADDEPMNSDKDLDLAQNFALGANERVCQIGGTYHSEWGKRPCETPPPDSQAFAYRRRGWDAIPQDFWGTFTNYGWNDPLPQHPLDNSQDDPAGGFAGVKGVRFLDDDGRAYCSTTGDVAYLVLLHANSPKFRPNWRGTCLDSVDDVTSVWRCERT